MTTPSDPARRASDDPAGDLVEALRSVTAELVAPLGGGGEVQVAQASVATLQPMTASVAVLQPVMAQLETGPVVGVAKVGTMEAEEQAAAGSDEVWQKERRRLEQLVYQTRMEYEETIEVKDMDISRLRQQIAHLNSTLASTLTADQKEAMDEEMAVYRNLVETTKDDFNDYVQSAQLRDDALKQDLETYKRRCAEAEAERDKLRVEHRAAATQLASLEMEAATVRAANAHLTEENEKLSNELNALHEMKALRTKQAIAKSYQTSKNVHQMRDRLKTECDLRQSAEAELGRITRDVDQLRRENSKLNQMNRDRAQQIQISRDAQMQLDSATHMKWRERVEAEKARRRAMEDEVLRLRADVRLMKELLEEKDKFGPSVRRPSGVSSEGGSGSGRFKKEKDNKPLLRVRFPRQRPSLSESQGNATAPFTLEHVLTHRISCEYFKQFLLSEYAAENLMFWKAVERYKEIGDPEEVAREARNIHSQFLAKDSEHEINIDAGVRTAVDAELANPTPILFDAAQSAVYELMRTDSYPRFITSSFCQQLMAKLLRGSLTWDESRKVFRE